MNKPGLILIGAGGHAHSCIDVIEQNGHYEIVGLIGRPAEMNTEHLGYLVIGADEDLPERAKAYQYALITVGHIRSPDTRIHLYQQATNLGFQLPTIVSPTAHVSRHATIGEGTVVLHGAIVNAGAKIGNNCIINTNALIEHDAIVEDHCHISTGAIINGEVVIGAKSFIGSASTIKEGVLIGERCLVGMGLSVRHNLTEQTRYVGDKGR